MPGKIVDGILLAACVFGVAWLGQKCDASAATSPCPPPDILWCLAIGPLNVGCVKDKEAIPTHLWEFAFPVDRLFVETRLHPTDD